MKDDVKIREMLKDLADDIPAHHTVPASMTRRARRRIAINSVALGTMVVALGVGAFAGVRSLAPKAEPTKLPFSSSSPAATPATVAPCTSGQLRAIGSLSGAAGSRVGGIELRNYSDRTCTLTGRPVVELFGTNGRRITSGVSFISSAAQWQANASPRPAGWPVVTLQGMNVPRQSAFIRIGWSNWCAQGGAAPLWRVGIPGSGTVDVINGMDQINPPPCNGPGQPSTIQVGPFEPRPAQ